MATLSNTHNQNDVQTKEKAGISQNFLTRYLTAIVLIPVGIFGMYMGGMIWTMMMALVMLFGGLEFYAMAQGRPRQGHATIGLLMMAVVLSSYHLGLPMLWWIAVPLGTLTVYLLETFKASNRHPLWCTLRTLTGVIYIGFPAAFLVSIRQQDNGFLWLIIIFAITWGTDTFAYFGGRLWGKHQLAPKLSPKKTIEGAVIGVLGGTSLSLAFVVAAGLFSPWMLVMVVVAPLIAVAGDLLESAMKRFYDIKDSHLPGLNIIPGHGGVLDRIDALIAVTLFCYPMMVLAGVVI